MREKTFRDIDDFEAEHHIPGATQEVDESGAAFIELLNKTKLTQDDVKAELSRWEKIGGARRRSACGRPRTGKLRC